MQYSTDGVNYNDIASLAYSTMPNPSGVAATSSLTNNLSGIASLQNVGSSTINYFRIVNWGAYNTAGTWYINDSSSIPATTPDFQVIGYVTSAGVAPHNLVVSPSSITTNAGATVAFTVTANGDPPTYSWYQGSVAPANLLAGQTTATLTLNDVIEANAGSYYVVLSNATGRATSAPVSLTVTDPAVLVAGEHVRIIGWNGAIFRVRRRHFVAIPVALFRRQWRCPRCRQPRRAIFRLHRFRRRRQRACA